MADEGSSSGRPILDDSVEQSLALLAALTDAVRRYAAAANKLSDVKPGGAEADAADAAAHLLQLLDAARRSSSHSPVRSEVNRRMTEALVEFYDKWSSAQLARNVNNQ